MLKRIPMLLVVPGFFISVAILASVFSRQPSYLGRSLTEWIEVYIRAQGPTMFHNDEVRKNEIVAAEAATAVRQIGTNGIGTLLRLVPSRRGYPVAYCGFQILGSSARAAAPSLIALTTNSDREIRDRALSCLLEVRAEEKVL